MGVSPMVRVFTHIERSSIHLAAASGSLILVREDRSAIVCRGFAASVRVHTPWAGRPCYE